MEKNRIGQKSLAQNSAEKERKQMTTEQFNKKSCELIERIQDLETQALLAKYELYELKAEYQKQLQNDKSVNNFIKFVEEYNRKLEEVAANDE